MGKMSIVSIYREELRETLDPTDNSLQKENWLLIWAFKYDQDLKE